MNVQDNPIMMINVLSKDMITLNEVELPPIVYKFRNWKNPDNPFHDNIILRNEIYIPNPNEFEDIKDCRNPIRYDLLSDDKLLLFIKQRLQNDHPRYNDLAIHKMAIEIYNRGHHRDKEWLQKFEDVEWEIESQMRGIYSVTSDPLNEIMWQKYGDEGKGLCYGFNTYNFILDTGLRAGGKVNYTAELPVISPFDDVVIQLWKRIYCKEDSWEFEDEYRLGVFGIRRRLVNINNDSLVQLILGPAFPEAEISTIIELLKARGGSVKLYRADIVIKELNRVEY